MPLTRRPVSPGALALGVVLAVGLALVTAPALAQARNPFGVGISEGGGAATGLFGWIMAQQGAFERAIAAAVRASRSDGSALWLLCGLSFLYGVLHAAGPGHGKAVIASYMVADERALGRGLVLSGLAALLQAVVAIALVGAMALVFHATAPAMRNAAATIEMASYAGIALLGALLVWRKASAFLRAWRALAAERAFRFAPATGRSGGTLAFAGARSGTPARAFACAVPHEHGPDCGHSHGPDPATLGAGFSWREAIATVVAAGARPCSGAILVLVFAYAQGMFSAGVAATLVMALGTALTTGALAATAVLFKTVALRLTGRGSGRGTLVARAIEVAAALLVLGVGVSLLIGMGPLRALS